MNNRILDVLEYSKIKDAIAEFLITEQGQKQLINLRPLTDRQKIQKQIDETKDGADLYRIKDGIPIVKMNDITAEIKRLKINATLNGTELYRISLVLQTSKSVREFFEQAREDGVELRSLYGLVDKLISIPTIAEHLQKSVDDKGGILDSASASLKHIRKTIKKSQAHVHEIMENYLQGSNSKYLTEAIITVRDGRYVLPVKQDSRNHFGGVVHDQSASGQTVYVEPQKAIELNNLVQDQEALEKQEVQRILIELSNSLRPYQSELTENSWILGHFDLINVKAKYAHQTKATEPIIDPDNHVDLKEARHPLIDPKKVVGNTVKFGDKYKNIIITGPNTGGKTITLKTVGLLELMAQSGLFIPANEESHVAVFTQIFADIGDEQSIEQNLSTFSSHLSNIIAIGKHLDDHSLVLLDELGAGTDPQEGAALAISLIESMSKSNCDMMVTTHYPELKIFAYNYPKTINASMEFDNETLQPTYRFLLGIPGSSNAFDIASRLGLNADVVTRARSLQSGESQDLNQMIQDLEKQRKNYENEYQSYRDNNEAVKKERKQLNQQLDQIDQRRDRMIDDAKEKANNIVDRSQTEADRIISRLRKLQKQSSQTTVKEDQLISAKTGLNKLHQNRKLRKNKVLRHEKRKQEIKVGDDVKVESYGQVGSVINKDKKGNFEVQLGILKMKLPARDLTKVKPEKEQPAQQNVSRQRAHSALPLKLDLRGERYDEAMADLDQYIDSALLAGYQEVTIVHGFGTGAIRKGVQKYLRSNPRVKKFAYAPANAGGQGATIAEF